MSLMDRLPRPTPLPDFEAAAQTLEGVQESLTVADLTERLDATSSDLELLRESLADVELALDDRGWRALNFESDRTFTREGLRRAARLTRSMALLNPLIRRGLSLRTAYVWGEGLSIQARANGDRDGEQDVNTVIQAFLDDPANRKVLTGGQAREINEHTLGTDGVFALACFTTPVTGRVQVREIPFDEIQSVIYNPEDRNEPWYYKRVWTQHTLDPGKDQPTSKTVTTYYPDIDYRPRGARPIRVNNQPVMWDAPMIMLTVNGLSGWDFGVGDAFAACGPARAYKGFLDDWAKLMRSLAKIAWKATSDSKGKAANAAAAARAQVDAGGMLSMGPGQTFEAVSKSGATIDAGSGRPLASLVAAALDLPVTMLLADPGITGARATAETLDTPTELITGLRRTVWDGFHDRLLGYVIDQAVKAPAGPLRGTVTRDEWDREVITLEGDTERTIQYDWPDLTQLDLNFLVQAIAEADATEKLPPGTIARLLLQAFGIRDVDEILDDLTDDDGNWIGPAVGSSQAAGQVAIDRFRNGEDPAQAL